MQTNGKIVPMDIKDKTQLKLKREDKRELAEPAVTAHGKQHFRSGDEGRKPKKGMIF